MVFQNPFFFFGGTQGTGDSLDYLFSLKWTDFSQVRGTT